MDDINDGAFLRAVAVLNQINYDPNFSIIISLPTEEQLRAAEKRLYVMKKRKNSIQYEFKEFEYVHVLKIEEEMDANNGGGAILEEFDGIIENVRNVIQYRRLYSLFVLKDGKIVSEAAWYLNHELTLLETQNECKAEEMAKEYRQKHPSQNWLSASLLLGR